MQSTLKDHMKASVKTQLGKKPTWHYHCRAATRNPNNPDDYGVNRPGKTARDAARAAARNAAQKA